MGLLGSLSQTASYSLAYTLGGILSTVILAPFTLAWPSAMFTIAKKDNAANVFGVVFHWYAMVLLLATFALSLFSTVLFDLLFPTPYHSAATIIPIIAVSIMFYGFDNIFMTGVSICRKTWFAVAFTAIAALVNLLLNLILIPKMGSTGAALSTLIAYILLAGIAYVVNQRIYPIPYQIGLFTIALIMGVAFYITGSFLATKSRRLYVLCHIY